MSAPYWGDVPQRRSSGHRRMSSDYAHPSADQRHSLDSQPPRRVNRSSVQTTYTEAPTESTFSPSSPTTSSFAGQGLAPRPPSDPRAMARGPALENLDRKPRRMPYDDDGYGLQDAPELPAAPDVPRQPPLSYRPRYTNPVGSQPPPPAARPSGYTSGAREHPNPMASRQEPPYGSRTDTQWAPNMAPPAATESRSVPANVLGQQRRTSASASSDRRKKLTNGQSPLQRLELTLDSMTKEEKRARVEAAEQRARQRAARNAQSLGAPEASDALARSPSERSPQPVPPPASQPIQAAHAPAGASFAGRRPSLRHDPIPDASRNDHGYPGPEPQHYEPTPTQASDSSSGLPKRNLSFRDRARTGGIPQEPPEAASSPRHAAPPPMEYAIPARSGSNKLRKEPPESLRQHKRAAVGSVPGPVGQANSPSSAVPPSARDKALPPLPTASRDAHPTAINHNQLPGDSFVPNNMRRRATEPVYGREYGSDEEYVPHPKQRAVHIQEQDEPQAEDDAALARRRLQRADSDYSAQQQQAHRVSNLIFKNPETMGPGDGLYKAPEWLDEWKKGAIGTLEGPLLDVETGQPSQDTYKAWWEDGGRRKGANVTARLRKAEAFDGEYDDSNNEPTRFKPPLYLKCGPLLRYSGIRTESAPSRSQRSGHNSDREMWRGSVMIVTQDADSSYEIAPMLRLFVQDVPLLPPPPQKVNGELPSEYVDPIAGHPKLGRRGETLYVRPVEHLEEAKDLSRIETDDGLFETLRSLPDDTPQDGSADLPGSFASRKKRAPVDGETLQKYKDVRGFRLHAEKGFTFWRFNLEIELKEKQQRIAYRINRGPCMAFWVPPRGESMNIMFHSCNGFSASVKPDELSGPDPMWRDVLNTHQSRPFHVMVGGGDQIYNDCVASQSDLFGEWLDIRNPFHKHQAAFTPQMQEELEQLYLERYCMWFSQGLFGLATSQIPMVNMYDDHDVFDGYGSYPHHDQKAPVFSGLGAVAFKYYMLFQHQSIMTETETTEPSWILGASPGPYINELSRSVYVSMGGKVALLAVDCRTERTEHDVIDEATWEKISSRLYAEVRRGQVEHLLVVLGVPIAYPRLVWLENILTSRLMDPVKALGRRGMFGKLLNNIDGGVEVVDDLNDHWTAKNHKQERSIIIEDLQDLAMDKSVRITILSGDVHLAAVGQFFSNPQLGLSKHKDPRYMPNIVSSAIVNTPPPDLLADVLNKRNKVHHFDKQTDENMIPMFHHGVDGKNRNNKHLLPHRNWCSIRQWQPGSTPPPTPPGSDHDRSPSPSPSKGAGLFRRLSVSRNASSSGFNGSRDSVRGSRPPVSGGLFRSLTRRNSTGGAARPGELTRTMSLGQDDRPKRGFFNFGRRGSQSGPRNADWDDDDYSDRYSPPPMRPSGLRGGALSDEFSDGDDADFAPRPPQRAQTLGAQPARRQSNADDPPIRPFHRTPTGLTAKQMRKGNDYSVDVEGSLDICLNVEVNAKDPTGITVPYRLLVPRLQYEYSPGDEQEPVAHSQPSGFKRLLSFRKKQQAPREREYDYDDDESYEGARDDGRY